MLKTQAAKTDLLLLFGLLVLTLLFAACFVDFSLQPIEDAAMLMRYAQHLAQGHGIVWNIGEAPIDGATDFLFMVSIALLLKLGLSAEFATRFLTFSAHILTIWIVYLALRRLFHAPLAIAVISALYLLVGPAFFYVSSYFGTTFFACAASITWYIALYTCQNEESHKSALLFGLAALITGLIRPEGVILTGLMLLTIIVAKGLRGSRLTITYFLAIFLVLGGTYFLWRWNYFGYPLPNPFYKKGGGHIYIDSLQISLFFAAMLCLPFLLAFIIGIFQKKTFRKTIAFSIPLIGFASAFILINNQMNIGARFQYTILPLTLMCWWPLGERVMEYLKLNQWNQVDRNKQVFIILLLVIVGAGLMNYAQTMIRVVYFRDGKYDVALMLSEYKEKGLSIATTESGLLPLYSGWRTLDTWGLNDQQIAHTGKVTEQRLKEFDPDIIMFHSNFTPYVDLKKEAFPGNWYEMDLTLKTYAEKNHYVLAAIFWDKPENNTDYYYVRPDFPESAEIIQRISTTTYYSNLTGKIEANYVGQIDPLP